MSKIEIQSDNIYISKSIDYINENITKKININEVCKYVNLSKYYFSRMFKAELGISPYKYILNCKMNEIKKDLEGGVDINTIVNDYGFYDLSHLNKRFQEIYGVTPLEYQRLYISKNQIDLFMSQNG